MAFRDCINSARAQGFLSKEEADDLLARHAAHRAERAAAGHADPDVAAKAALAKALDGDAARARWHAQLDEDKRVELTEAAETYKAPNGKASVYETFMRKLENFGHSGFQSVAGDAKAIVGLMHGELEAGLRQFEKNYITGFRHQQPAVRDLVRDMLGEPSGRAESAAFASSMAKVFERLRVLFNEAGGNIGKIENYIPQFHDPSALRAAKFEKWRGDILPRLAPEKMRDPITGEPMRPERLEEAMRPAFDQITTQGWSKREATSAPVGRGSVANQRADHRFFVFKAAEDWLWYNQHYGKGDPLSSMFQHINGMARDIAAMRQLGPNPGLMVEWMKQKTLAEHGKWIAGEDSTFQRPAWYIGSDLDAGKSAAQGIDDLYYWVRGRSTVNQNVADFFGDVRNVLTSAYLGSAAILAATTDPFIERAARRQIGISDAKLFGSNAKVYLDSVAQYFEALPIVRSTLAPLIDMATGAPRKEAARAGMIMDQYLHIMGDEARYAGSFGGHFWSRWLAERTVNLSGLIALTESRRAVFQLEIMAEAADHTNRAFADLPERLRGKFEGYGIDAKGWDRMREVPHYTPGSGSSGFLRPKDIEARNFNDAARFADMILGETERAVPTSTMRSKAAVMGQRPRGSVIGELIEGGLQFKGFPLSIATLQMEAVAQEAAQRGKWSGASYAAQIFGLTTLGGALAIQFQALKDGKDAQNMSDPKFWIASMAKGGGMGIYGDFLFKDYTQMRNSFAEQLAGPTVSFANDVAKFIGGNLERMPEGKSNWGHEAVRLFGRNTPVASSLWPTRLLYQREVIDQLDYMVDPRAHRRWREEQRRAMHDKGQGFWWPHGQTSPDRLPRLDTAVGQ